LLLPGRLAAETPPPAFTPASGKLMIRNELRRTPRNTGRSGKSFLYISSK
jgi:hypothetical protein